MNAKDITGLVLAGGRASRMGGADKGLQPLPDGTPLALHAARKLWRQTAAVLISANRNCVQYQSWGMPVLHDDAPEEFAGPLAGILSGMRHCRTPYLLTVPCDAPFFPDDLARRMGAALLQQQAGVAVAAQTETTSPNESTRVDERALKLHPTFALLHVTPGLIQSLHAYLARGQHKLRAWTEMQNRALAIFAAPADGAQVNAFMNINTAQDLLRAQTLWEQSGGAGTFATCKQCVNRHASEKNDA